MVSCSPSIGQENIMFKYSNRSEIHISFLDLCDIEARKEYMEISSKPNDSVVLYIEGFRKGTEFSVYTDKKKYSMSITKDYLIHQMYVDYIVLRKEELLTSSSLSISIKSDLPNYPEYSYNYKFRLDNIDDRILNSKSLVINIDKDNDREDYAILGYSQVDEVKYQKIKRKCTQRIMENKKKDKN